jgi:DNA invertase Pin-like site-specific DNA recombinase
MGKILKQDEYSTTKRERARNNYRIKHKIPLDAPLNSTYAGSIDTHVASKMRGEGKPFSEIGRLLGVSRQAVHQLLKRHRKKDSCRLS